MSIFLMYILVKLNSFIILFVILACLFFILGLIGFCASFLENKEKYKKETIKLGIATICFGFLSFALPTTKEAAVIYLVPTIINNEKVQSIGSNSLEILEKYTQEWLKELTKKEKSNEKTDL